MIKRLFDQWLFEDVEIEFGIERVKKMPSLLKWLDISDKELKNIVTPSFEKLRISIEDNIEIWNEDELKMMFIAPFLMNFKFNDIPHYRVFSQRYMSFKTEKVEANGRVEWMISSGKQRPRHPFFFLQEYKPEKTSGNDPLGQLLIAMINAQKLNNNEEKILYGCYIIGRFWFFVILEGKKYSVSNAYNASLESDLGKMIVILKRVENAI